MSAHESTQKRVFAYDVIRAFAILGVVLIHLTFPIYARPDFLGGTAWWIAQVLNTLSRMSIPLFILLSGCLLLPKEEPNQKIWQRILHRLLIPLVAWSVLYISWDYFWFNKTPNLAKIGTDYLSGGIYSLYFLFIMIALYLLLPVLRLIIQKGSEELKKYFLELTALFSILYTFLVYVVFKNAPLVMLPTVGLPYIFYFMAGHYLAVKKIEGRTLRNVSFYWVLSLLVGLGIAFLNLQQFSWGSTVFWRRISYFDEYTSLPVMLSALLGFVVLINVNYDFLEKTWVQKFITLLSKSAMAIYLVHPLIIDLVDHQFDLRVDFMDESLMEFLALRIFFVFLYTMPIAALIRIIPGVKKIVGE